MTQAAVNTEQLSALLAERQRFETWIAQLDAKRSETPPHIYDRVHADYVARLQKVREHLAQYRTAIKEMEASLIDRLTSLDIDEAKHRDEAAEASLRAAVGEIAPDVARDVEARALSRLGALSAERESVSQELDRLRAVLDAGAAQPESPRVPTPPVAAPVAAAERTSRPARAETSPAVAAQAPPAPAGTERPAGTPHRGPFDDLEFLKTMVDARSSERRPDTPAPAAAAVGQRAARASGEVPRPAPVVEAPTIRHTEEPSLTAKEQPADQVKTLKCQECGTLNYPTEWYCERCGAELAAL